jgi:CBS domain containing-hemolysin-like protein
LQPASESEHAISPDELEYVLSHAHHPHPHDALVNKLMVQSLRLRETTAQQIMLPGEQIVALWLDRPLADNVRVAQTSGHSRFPVCEGTLDNVKGIVLAREWLWQLHALGAEASFAPLVRPALTFERKTPLPVMMERFRASRTHLALVLDEQKRLAGLVTFEDVLEEIVGDIRDEFDIGRGPVYERTEKAITVNGALTMRELQAETGWPLEWQPRETVAQWTLRHAGRVPQRDETITAGDYTITALDVTAERIRRLRVERAFLVAEN